MSYKRMSIVISSTVDALENERRDISGQIAKLQLRAKEIDKVIQSLSEAQLLIRRLEGKE